ncbi:hypothetical protein ACQEVB_05275 [Pseudonocardia sp. CA-107938]|uniref:hypothetical protein n=1 Tax=Pseudonocardia sp. CA-107938 TaxID=3240021 RepID=UPI003D8D81DA
MPYDIPAFNERTPLGPPDSALRKEQVRRWFRPSPDPAALVWARRLLYVAAAASVASVATFLAGQPIAAAVLFVGAVVTLIQGLATRHDYWRRHAWAEPTPLSDVMRDGLDDDRNRAADHAMTRFGLTPDQLRLHGGDVGIETFAKLADRPLTIIGPAKGARARRGLDRVWRFTAYDVMVICPTERLFCVFEGTLDTVTGRIGKEQTHEYYYDDVVAVLTNPRTAEAMELVEAYLDIRPAPLRDLPMRSFEIVASSGDRCEVSVIIGPLYFAESRFDTAMNVVRTVLLTAKR